MNLPLRCGIAIVRSLKPLKPEPQALFILPG